MMLQYLLLAITVGNVVNVITADSTKTQPNIIFFVTDDWGVYTYRKCIMPFMCYWTHSSWLSLPFGCV